MCKIFYILLLFFIFQPRSAIATVIEFNDDGSLTTYEAFDYLSSRRHLAILKLKPTKDISTLILKTASFYNVDPNLVMAIIQVESSFNSNALSPKGAQGLMQLMPETALKYGANDAFNMEQNIDAGIHLISDLLEKYDGNIKLVLAAYNAGEGAVKKYNGIPPYRETIEYINKIEQILYK